MDNSQLVKKNNVTAGYTKIYPITYLQGIIDGASGKYVEGLFRSINHVYVEYNTDTPTTRLSVDNNFRRKGLWLTYEKNGTIYTEEYIADNSEDTVFALDENWQVIPDVKYVQENASKIPDKAILPKHLSSSLQELINEKKTVVNLVDDEDLEQDCGIIRFKDRNYVNNENKGYKILRKNWIQGKNVLLSAVVSTANTIYEIRYDFDLKEETIVLPSNCTLLFKGGTINNGTITCDNTNFIGINKFSDAGTAVFNGTFLTGLILNIDNNIKWYNGTEWKTIESNSSLVELNAEVVECITADSPSASVKAIGNNLQFKFGIPKGEKGDKGDTGEINITELELTAEARESPQPYAGMEVTNNSIKFNFGIPVGEKGEKGEKGDSGVKPDYKTYIYKKSNIQPDKPNSIKLVPDGWQDYPTDSEGLWWQCIGNVNGFADLVTEWSEVVQLNGQTIEGKKVEFRFAKNTSSTTSPSIIPYDRNPEGWSIETPTIDKEEYLWMSNASIDSEDNLDTPWSTPIRINGEKGKDGEDGAAGKLIYPAGVYSVSTVYTADKYKAPYVFDTTDSCYYVLNKTMSWKGTEQSNKAPSQSSDWLKFETFEAIYAKIGIIANGLVGSAVFNGDYMFSQQGINPSTTTNTTNYQLFDATNIYSGTFTPNILFNFKTGAGHLAAGALKWDENGNLTLNNLYIKGYIQEDYKYVEDITNSEGNIDLDLSGDCKNYIITSNKDSTTEWLFSTTNIFSKQHTQPVTISIYNNTDIPAKFNTKATDAIGGFPCDYIYLGARKHLKLVIIPTQMAQAWYANTYIENIADFHYEWVTTQLNTHTTLVSNTNYGSAIASGKLTSNGIFTGNNLTLNSSAVSTSVTFDFISPVYGNIIALVQKTDGTSLPYTIVGNTEIPTGITVTRTSTSDAVNIIVFAI